jgi:hypothetical protein
MNILILELISGILCGAIQLVNERKIVGFYGAIFSCITLIMLLFDND